MPTKAMTLELVIMATGSTSSKATNNLGVATNSYTIPLGDQEVMMKATVRPHHVGWLAKHHRADSATTTDIVAPHHTMP